MGYVPTAPPPMNWWETSDPVPQVTAHCPFCGRWYRDARTICTEGCGGTLQEVKRIYLKARKVSFSNIPVIGESMDSRFLRRGLGPNATRAGVERGEDGWPWTSSIFPGWPHTTPTTEVRK